MKINLMDRLLCKCNGVRVTGNIQFDVTGFRLELVLRLGMKCSPGSEIKMLEME